MTVKEFLARLKNVTPDGDGWMASSPCHEDSKPSLSVKEGADGRIVLYDFSGYSTEQVVAAMGLTMADLFPKREPAARELFFPSEQKKLPVVAQYDYLAKDGKPLCRVFRGKPKAFARCALGPNREEIWKKGATTGMKALYRWPELAAAVGRGEAAYMVEGEKDVDNARRIGLNATHCLGGAKKWHKELAAEFRGASSVTVIADNDAPGRKHALDIKPTVIAQGVPCRVVCLPAEINGRKVKDISDAIAAGWGRDEIERWCASAKEIEPAAQAAGNGGANPAPPSGHAAKIESTGTLREAILEAIAAADDDSAAGRREAFIPVALEWLRNHGSFYCDKGCVKDCGALYFSAGTKRLMKLAGDDGAFFRSWLARESGLNRETVDFRHLASECVDEALVAERTPKLNPAFYWTSAPDGETVYISCGDGRMAKISAGKVEMADNGTDGILFAQGRTCREWTLLERAEGSPLWDLAMIGGMASEDPLAPLLLSLWVLALPMDFKNKPPLSLCGEVGSGKSKTAAGISEALGLPPRTSTPRKDDAGADEFWVMASNGGIPVFDNIDSGYRWLPDAVSSASTGGSRTKRALYTNDEEVNLRSRAAIILTSANANYATDAGLADRLINIKLERNRSNTDDAALSKEAIGRLDATMTWMAWTIADALAVKERPAETFNRRHPDWAAWCWRCGVALGFRDEAEMAMKAAERDKALVSVLSDAIFGEVLYRYMIDIGGRNFGKSVTLSAKGLRDELVKFGEYGEDAARLLTPHSIGKKLQANRAQYQEVFGLRSFTGHAGQTFWTLYPPKEDGKRSCGRFRTRFMKEDGSRESANGGCGDCSRGISIKPPENFLNTINNIKCFSEGLRERGVEQSPKSPSEPLDDEICDGPFVPPY